MGFLNWHKSQPSDADSQLTVFGGEDSLQRSERVDRATIRSDLTKAINNTGAPKDTYKNGTEQMTNTLFGCSTEELYEETGGKKGDRDTLPKSAQKAYMAAESKATFDIEATTYHGNSEDVGKQIENQMGEAGSKTRKFFGLW